MKREAAFLVALSLLTVIVSWELLFQRDSPESPTIRSQEAESASRSPRQVHRDDEVPQGEASLPSIIRALGAYRNDRAQSLSSLGQALGGVAPGEFPEALQTFLRLLPPGDADSAEAYGLLFRSWGRVDGIQALNLAMTALPENGVRLAAGREAMRMWAQKDPATVARYLQSLPDTFGKDYLVYALPYEYVAQAPREAAAWANALPPNLRRTALLHTMIKWLDQDADEARSYAGELAQHPDEVNNDNGVIFFEVAAHFGDSHPSDTAKWIASLPPDSKAREWAMQGLIDRWVISDPGKASEWLLGFEPSPTVDPALARFALDIVRGDPAQAAEWGASISSEAERNACLARVLDIWMRSEPIAARSWARSNAHESLIPVKAN